jgi:hypothetical protein
MSTIDVTAPAFSAVTDADHAGWVIITCCAFLVFSFLALGAKLLIAQLRPVKPGFLRSYDVVLVVATVCSSLLYRGDANANRMYKILALVQTACVISACKHGLGRYRAEVGDDSFELVSKVRPPAVIDHDPLIVLLCGTYIVFLCCLDPVRRIASFFQNLRRSLHRSIKPLSRHLEPLSPHTSHHWGMVHLWSRLSSRAMPSTHALEYSSWRLPRPTSPVPVHCSRQHHHRRRTRLDTHLPVVSHQV